MKKLFCKGILTCLLICLFGIGVHASSGSYGAGVQWTLENGTLTISGSGETTEYDEISAVPWYEMRDSITRVVVEEGITYLGKWSFYGLENVTEISLPSTLKSVGSGVIRGCNSLSSLELPEGLESLGYMSVSECDWLTDITIPSTLTDLSDEVFTDLPMLLKFHVSPDNDTLIFQDDLLINVKTMTVESGAAASGRVEIPVGIQTIKIQAFMGNPAITDLIVPEGVTEIEGMALYGCDWLTNVYLPSSLQKLGMYAMHRSEDLEAVYYAGSSSQWNGITFPSMEDESLTKVEKLLHYDYPVPHSGTTVGENVVYADSDWSEPTVEQYSDWSEPTVEQYSGGMEYENVANGVCGDSMWWEIIQWADNSTGESGCFLSLYGSGDMWDYSPENPAPWKEYSGLFSEISFGYEHITSIGDYAFYDCENVDVVFLSEGIARIGDNCMTGCSLMDVIFYDGTLEQWEQVAVEGNNEVLLSALHYYVPEEDTYYPLSYDTETTPATEPEQESEMQQETSAAVSSPVVIEDDSEESGMSSTMILVIVALVVLVIAIGTSTTVIILVLRRNKQVAQATQAGAAAPPPPVNQQQYGNTQNNQYDPYSQYRQDDN